MQILRTRQGIDPSRTRNSRRGVARRRRVVHARRRSRHTRHARDQARRRAHAQARGAIGENDVRDESSRACTTNGS